MRRAVSKLCQRLAVDASVGGVSYEDSHTFAGEEVEIRDSVNESFGAEGDVNVGPDSVFGVVPEVRSRSAILSRRSGGDVSFDNQFPVAVDADGSNSEGERRWFLTGRGVYGVPNGVNWYRVGDFWGGLWSWGIENPGWVFTFWIFFMSLLFGLLFTCIRHCAKVLIRRKAYFRRNGYVVLFTFSFCIC